MNFNLKKFMVDSSSSLNDIIQQLGQNVISAVRTRAPALTSFVSVIEIVKRTSEREREVLL